MNVLWYKVALSKDPPKNGGQNWPSKWTLKTRWSNNWVKIDYECDVIRSGSWIWDLLKSGGQNWAQLKVEF